MKKWMSVFFLIGCLAAVYGQQQKVMLPNGWSLTPAGKQVGLGDLPMNMAVSPNKKYLAITNNGQSIQSLQLVDVATAKVLDSLNIGKSWYGLEFSADGSSLFASGGNDNWILKYNIINNHLKVADTFKLGKRWPEKISPAGIALNEGQGKMYVVTKEDNALYAVNLTNKQIEKFALGAEAYACVLSPDKKFLYISLWGTDRLLVWNTQTKKEVARLAIGDNPNELLLTKNGNFLYVANANDNSVAVVNTKTLKIVEVLNSALFPNAPNGSTTNGLAFNENESMLYVANADNNCLAVFDVKEKGFSKSAGFIPVGWYPTNVKVIAKTIFVTNGKGLTSLANPFGPNPIARKQAVNYQKGDGTKPPKTQYIGGLFTGCLSVIPEPNALQLAQYSKQVYENTPYTKEKELMAAGEKGNPIPMNVGDTSPIKHVFYIIKENRTYDQVLGDLPQGNGDTSLVLFGRKYTPNQHALVEEFVLLDNFYVDAEVSADGHNWSLAAYANDYTEKNWPTSYGGRGGTYDFEGQKRVAYPKGGFIWDHCLRAGISFRTYGEFADDYKPNYPTIEGKFCTYFTSWDEKVRDTTRVYQWKRDFDSLVAINALPQLNTLRLINDHTEGGSIGRPTPFAHVADNDYSVGMFIEYLSKSPVWDKSVVFILEDDAQNGPDHVDAHRSTAYVIGPHVKRKFVDHTMYSTSSMLRTIELILGLPPMSQYDAGATPMWRCFTPNANTQPFTALAPLVDITEKNVRVNSLSKISETFDFSKEDRAPDLAFSEVLWKMVKGENSVMPAPRRSAFVVQTKEEEAESAKRKYRKGKK